MVSDGGVAAGRDRFPAVDGVACRPLGAAIGPGSTGPAVAGGEVAGLVAAAVLGAGEPGSGPAVPSVVVVGDPAGCVLAVDDADGVSGALDDVTDGPAEVVGALDEVVGGLEDVVAAAVVDASLVVG